uniref:Probable ubiquitin-like-specific protease 2B isoform X1 n=1 Tax=Tanacetum cinerariifolium TaxID=118510 RepID=A0A6L2P0V4_TANCI|nr:probable ubiquitin-like-specific protease 2B isoform X1 [Tanacetum cinerariifolium]
MRFCHRDRSHTPLLNSQVSQFFLQSETANICIRIKPKVVTSGQNSGVLEVEFSILDSDLISTQDKIKSLDAQYMEKWDVDLE